MPQRLALPVAHAHNRVRNAVDANLLADRIAVAKQVVHNVVSHNHVVRAVFFVGGGKAATNHHIGIVQRNHGPRHAAHVGVGGRVPVVDHARCALEQRPNLAAFVAAVSHRLVIFETQDLALLITEVVLGVEDHAGHPRHGKHIRAMVCELGRHIPVGPVHQGNHHDHRCHPHHHANQRENGAQLVRPERLEREFDGFTELHDPAFPAVAFLKTISQVYAIFARCDLRIATANDETPAHQAAPSPQRQPLRAVFFS